MTFILLSFVYLAGLMLSTAVLLMMFGKLIAPVSYRNTWQNRLQDRIASFLFF